MDELTPGVYWITRDSEPGTAILSPMCDIWSERPRREGYGTAIGYCWLSKTHISSFVTRCRVKDIESRWTAPHTDRECVRVVV